MEITSVQIQTAGTNNSETITYLEFEGGETYEIKSQYNGNPSNISCEKLWLNGAEVWNVSNGWRKFDLIVP